MHWEVSRAVEAVANATPLARLAVAEVRAIARAIRATVAMKIVIKMRVIEKCLLNKKAVLVNLYGSTRTANVHAAHSRPIE
jgi:hypothetical protein